MAVVKWIFLTLTLAASIDCGGSIEDEPTEEVGPEASCVRSAYELVRTRYRCTSAGELQTLECGEWLTLEVCDAPSDCSPGPDPGCR